jgi:hypothetical protein
VPVRWIDADDALVRRAAAIKARGGLSHADAFAAGPVSVLDCPVLTGDPEFRMAEELGVTVRWLGPRAPGIAPFARLLTVPAPAPSSTGPVGVGSTCDAPGGPCPDGQARLGLAE